ncbi:MAG TPA: EamA family transporter RarD [Acidimicrobiales bacterium]|nr:EamA family transporter RarD [Acidimicrobiales bacterium]
MEPEAGVDRGGALAGVAAYSLWGLFPLVFHRLRSVSALEILFHRVVWSFCVVALLLLARRTRGRLAPLVLSRRRLGQLVGAAVLIATNWLVYIWAVNHGHVVEAALGYYINPLITVALGVWLLGERLRRAQLTALAIASVAVVVLSVAYGRPPWVALTLAGSFAGYGFLKKAASLEPVVSLAAETCVLLPCALIGLVVLEARGSAAFLHGSVLRDLALLGLGVVTAVPLLLFGAAARRIPLSLLGLLQYLTPTLQLLCGLVFLGESLDGARLAGFVIVWLALVVLAADALQSGQRRAAGRARARLGLVAAPVLGEPPDDAAPSGAAGTGAATVALEPAHAVARADLRSIRPAGVEDGAELDRRPAGQVGEGGGGRRVR